MSTRTPVLLATAVATLAVCPAAALAATPQPVKITSADEVTPSASPSYVSWAVQPTDILSPADTKLFVQKVGSKTLVRVNPKNTNATGGGIFQNTLVYNQSTKSTTADLYLYDLSTHKRTKLAKADTNADEYAPSISGRYVFFSRSLGQSTKVILFDRATGLSKVLAQTVGSNAEVQSGQVSGNFAVWANCHENSAGFFCSTFERDIAHNKTTQLTNSVPGKGQGEPSVTPAGTVYFDRFSNATCGGDQIMKQPLGQTPTVVATMPSDVSLKDTYALSQPSGVTVFFDRYRCTNQSNDDVYKVAG